MVVLLGAGGVGAVWGWYVGLADARAGRRAAVLLAATPLLFGEVASEAGLSAAALSMAAAGVAWLTHAGWRRVLAGRAAAR